MHVRLVLAAFTGMAIMGTGVFADNPTNENGHRGADRLTLHVMPQSHIDLAWWWRYEPETLHVIIPHTLETAFGNMEKFPDYTFSFLQVPAIEPLEEAYPDLFYKLRYYAHRADALDGRIPNPLARGGEGRLAIASGTWCEFDGCLPCGESLVRQCLHGKRYFRKAFGMDVRTAWFQDAWTHPWTLPQILKKSGMDTYMFTRPRGGGESMFWWEAPDGSRVFAHKPLTADGESLPGDDEIRERLEETRKKYGVADDFTLIGVGNHGGGAIRADVERMRAAMKKGDAKQPLMEFSTPARFVEKVLAQNPTLPVVQTELEATIRGAYTSVSGIKKGNRDCENLLLTAEKFSSIAAWLGLREYPARVLEDSWKKVMLNQFHDTISGTDIPASIGDALTRYEEVRAGAGAELHAALLAIAEQASTTGPGTPLVVFNPLAWERTDWVEAQVALDRDAQDISLVDDQGNAVAHQPLERKETLLRFVFLAEHLPSLGYRTYHASPSRTAPSPPPSDAAPGVLENEYFKVMIDQKTGCLAAVHDKVNGRDVLASGGGGNAVQIHDDYGDSEGFLKSQDGREEHNVWAGPFETANTNPEIRLVENGPVRMVMEVKQRHGLARFAQRIILGRKVPRIEFEISVDWTGSEKMVKLAFPLAVSSPVCACEIPYGVITRASNGEECAAQNWVDISGEGYGVGLLNDGRYGHDITPGVIRLSLLRSPDHPVRATDEAGTHRLRYALQPHAGDWRDANLVRRGLEFNNPPIAVAVSPHEGGLPPAHSFVRVEPENVVLSALKKAEDSNDLVVRSYETQGAPCRAFFHFAKGLAFDAVHATNLLEESREALEAGPESYEAEVGAFSIESHRLIRDWK